MIEYIGEQYFGQLLFTEDNIPSGPGRREWIMDGLRSAGIDVKATFIPFQTQLNDLPEVVKLSDFPKYIDNPAMALFIGKGEIAIFDYRMDYADIRESEFGKDKIYHLLRFAQITACQKAKLVVVSDEKFVDFVKEFNENVVVIPNGPEMVSEFIKLVKSI